MRRIAPPLVALAVLLLGFVGAVPANADDPLPPPAFPSGLSSPEDIGNDVGTDPQTEPGPTYEVTPGSPGTALPEPNSAQVDDARAALDRLNGKKTEKTQRTQVAGPVAGETEAAEEDDTNWYLIGSGLLLLLVLTELGRINVAAAQHRRRSE